ncbi:MULTISPECIES: caspase family protein [Brevibacillus]|uniref:Caspase family protein n=1 Tax=Brevibacillus antibioticus TaxID=2570228 RepID=A0A4U2YCP0_9BACL|nr:caspase family protein [Brevibacillus antibioticus]TKI57832.1 caspase family protein [Brevibacillus antibioticus]
MIPIAYKAFLVAVNKNISPDFSDLPNTINDVREVKRLLMEKPSNFDDANVQEFTGTISKKTIITAELEAFFESATNEDILFLFWAGHGYLHQGEGYLVPFDGSTHTDSSMIRMADVKSLIDNSKAKVIFSLFDTCHSGSIARSQDILRGLQITGSGKVIIAACQPNQYAYDRNGHGAFSDYLIQGLSGAAANQDGIIDVYNLYSFISSKLSTEFQSGVQVPALYSSTLTGQPIEIRRVILRNDENQSPKGGIETILDNSGTSYWLGNISSEFDSFSEVSAGVYKLTINNPPVEVENGFRKLNEQKTVVGFAVRNQACLIRIVNMNITSGSSGDTMVVELSKVEGKHESTMMDMAYGGSGRRLSADEIASIRAKILIFGDEDERRTSSFGDTLLESLINNPTNGSVKVIPNLISSLQDKNYSLTRIRVITIAYLILTGTVEQIEKLSFKVTNGIISEVTFIGYRKKYYSNVDPYRIELTGELRK